MTDRPIIFSAPMVRALLDGRKKQTRRLATSPLCRCEVGDRLYVREAWRFAGWSETECEFDYLADDARSQWLSPPDDNGTLTHSRFLDREAQRAHDLCEKAGHMMGSIASPPHGWLPGRPSIHMPRWASRLTLIVEGVRIERLQAISAEDAIAEGIERTPDGWRTYDGGPRAFGPRESYASLWASLHAEEGQRWQDNPDVVALTFSVERGNIDQVPA